MKVAPGGLHLIIDVDDVDPTLLGDEGYLRTSMIDAAKAAGATVLGNNFHHFGDGHGVTGLIILAESHISVHTWPEKRYAAFDIFMCGNCDTNTALYHLQKKFPGTYFVNTIQRRSMQGTKLWDIMNDPEIAKLANEAGF